MQAVFGECVPNILNFVLDVLGQEKLREQRAEMGRIDKRLVATTMDACRRWFTSSTGRPLPPSTARPGPPTQGLGLPAHGSWATRRPGGLAGWCRGAWLVGARTELTGLETYRAPAS